MALASLAFVACTAPVLAAFFISLTLFAFHPARPALRAPDAPPAKAEATPPAIRPAFPKPFLSPHLFFTLPAALTAFLVNAVTPPPMNAPAAKAFPKPNPILLESTPNASPINLGACCINMIIPRIINACPNIPNPNP